MKASKDQQDKITTLKQRQNFVEAAQSDSKWVSETLILQVNTPEMSALENTDHDYFIGYTVTKKIGNAVIRNRIKRRLRAAVAEIFPDHAQKHKHYVIIARHGALSAKPEKIRADLKWCLKRLKDKT